MAGGWDLLPTHVGTRDTWGCWDTPVVLSMLPDIWLGWAGASGQHSLLEARPLWLGEDG